jgi:Ca-activated chloride channel family protein
MFVDRFAESVLVAARGVRVELTLPSYFNIKKFYGEGYSPDPAKIKPQHLAPNDSMVFFQILHPCDRTMARATDSYRVKVTWSDPLTGEARESVQDTTLGQLDIDDGNLSKAAVVVAWAEMLKELRGMPTAERIAALDQVRLFARQLDPTLGDPDLKEIDELATVMILSN